MFTLYTVYQYPDPSVFYSLVFTVYVYYNHHHSYNIQKVSDRFLLHGKPSCQNPGFRPASLSADLGFNKYY